MSTGYAPGQAPGSVNAPGARTYADPSPIFSPSFPFRALSGPLFYPEGDGGAPPADPPADPPKPADPPAPAVTPSTLTELQQQLADATKQIGELRREAAGYRTSANDYKTKLDELDREKLTREQQLEADVKKYRDDLLPALQAQNRTLEVQVAASAKNVVDAEAATQLLDWKSVESGTSIDAALDALIAAKPWLIKAPAAPVAAASATTSPAAGSSATGPRTSFTAEEIDAMPLDEYEKNKPAILDALKHGKIARQVSKP